MRVFFSGAKESRTPDLLHAMQALYQLSYNPEDAHKYRMNYCACQGHFEKNLMKFFLGNRFQGLGFKKVSRVSRVCNVRQCRDYILSPNT